MQRSKSNDFDKEIDKTSELLGEALLNAIRLAVREEIREALIQGGFSFDDRLLHTEEASKGAAGFAGLALSQLSQITVHTEGRGESPTLFLSRDPDVDSQGFRPSFAKMVSRMRFRFPYSQECVSSSGASALQQKICCFFQ
jgi:hypothetical protein